jgi:LysR family transcriptional activator of nhaA
VDEQPVALVGKAERPGRRRSWRTRLASEPLVVPTLESGVRAGLDELMHRLGLHPVLAAEVDDMAMLRLLVRNGVGLGVVPSIVVRDELQAGTLTRITVLPGLRETFYAITLPRHFGNPLVAELIGAARSAAKPGRRGVPVQPGDTSQT